MYDYNYAASELAYNKFLEKPIKEAISVLDIKPGQRILDFGCGPGLITEWLSQAVEENGQVIGLDISKNHIDFAKDRLKNNPNIKLAHCDILKKNKIENEKFDLIWISNVFFPHTTGSNNSKIIKILKAHLNPNGKVAIFYSNWMRMLLLPGYSKLEHWISIANENSKSLKSEWNASIHPETIIDALIGLGFHNCSNTFISNSHQFPLKKNIKKYLDYHLNTIYQGAINKSEYKIPNYLLKKWDSIRNPKSKDYILNANSYYCATNSILTLGYDNL